MRQTLAIAVLCAAICSAQASADSPASDAHSIILKMSERNPGLTSFRAPVHVDVRMLNFPFLSPKLDGSTYYKKPGKYEVVFARIPRYAEGFQRLFNDVGDPIAWEKDQNVTFAGTQQVDGRPLYVLNLTKKIHSTILDHALAFVDPQSYELWRMEWHYTSGGTITMRQWYRSQGSYSVLSQQHADIDIPHVRAVADSKYGTYETNVAVDDAVFTKK